ncbi:hypothetical protein [Desulfobaculum bizertense]|uniref:Tetratricopeptide repeat-containing protein n=1 Tax=Desulfobaculum bizertense DSM 18034 TaxID=1121442 RepID=A0A1T4W6C5_9BACT|nr:hypothetical protein [Desulfobaculum bizertense]SKA72786.1 hypothetical protein SAMN02745702_01698 [Desulfobaculum bizertense DSM 18034]
MKKHFLLATTAVCVLALSGCSTSSSPRAYGDRLDTLPYSQTALSSLAQGREYQAQGRYELARQTFVDGLMAAKNPELKATLKEEIASTDRIIRSRR